MARTTQAVKLKTTQEEAERIIKVNLTADGYKLIDYDGEDDVWRKGTGVMTAMHYIKPEFEYGDTLYLSGWVRSGIDKTALKEQDLEGFVGMVPKKSVKATMEKILQAV